MASEVDWLLLKDTGIDPNLTENHVQCMCHKIALILNAGLQSIQISSKGFVPTQLDILGLVPGIAPIIEDKKLVTLAEPKFRTMLLKMQTKTNSYLSEALQCNAVLIATILNPSFRLSIFKVSFPSYPNYSCPLISNLFEIRKAGAEAMLVIPPEQSTSTGAKKSKSKNPDREDLDYFPEAVDAPTKDKLDTYLESRRVFGMVEAM
ncbi:hypothetical protein MJO28_008678 [Puccinia striiformis f. sp. tritici]|uniref:Uncharacterized protein n=1 Tax=Puccinia striiformis f. sp. tritici TaxID=168172 RepID=A0ACC0EDF0_9BASI|nr:hypothetical protein MJO28_008678 [Puccinia striiformis f. sp. tritici]